MENEMIRTSKISSFEIDDLDIINEYKLKPNDELGLTVRTASGPNGPIEMTFDAVVTKNKVIKTKGWNQFLFCDEDGDILDGTEIDIHMIGRKAAGTSSKKSKAKKKVAKKTSKKVAKSVSKSTATPKRRELKVPARNVIFAALKKAKGNKTAAAKQLNVSPRTFGRWVEKFLTA
jgi:transcriptional regulator of acetoin/glycerol metabolism